jgi:hypothetical protein
MDGIIRPGNCRTRAASYIDLNSVPPLCSLCLCGECLRKALTTADTEDTEGAQRKTENGTVSPPASVVEGRGRMGF